ncbi:hypothetical protein SMICM304S_11057 [Streptomyces microflavus]
MWAAAVALSLTVRTSDFDQATVRESFESREPVDPAAIDMRTSAHGDIS